MSAVTRTVSCLLAGWLMLTTVGCATLNLSKIDFRSRKASSRNPAVKVVCLWEPAEGRDPDGLPCQGFAGQVLFLTRDSLPVSVDGDVRIYLFDDHGTLEQQTKPFHNYDFDSGSWAQHYTYGALGPAYSVFVPYTRKGVQQATCALRVRLTPKDGPVVFSEMTSMGLGLSGGSTAPKRSSSDSRVEETTPEDLTTVNNRRRTTTIVLNGKNGTDGNSTESPSHAGVDKVQQAKFEADLRPMSNEDARIRQLEDMVKELRAAQAMQAPAAAPPKASLPPQLLEEIENTRIKVRAMDVTPAEVRTPKSPSENSSTSKSSRREPQVRVVDNDHPHPLDDEAPVRTRPRKKHIIEDADDSLFGKAEVERSARRHPLDDDDQPVERTAKRKKPVEVPQVDHDRGSSADPFDPIDTEAIETTSVDSTPTIRRQLRSVSR